MNGPLENVRVLDVATMLAAPLTAQILGDFGAEVIKVEHPLRPDMMRGHGPFVDGESLWWKEIGRNKRTVGIDLSTPAGRDLLLRLVATTDVMIENFRPGTLERWGLGTDVLRRENPDLILLRVTGFGQTGPYAGRAAFGTLIEAMSGFAAVTGEPDGPPTLPPFGLADSLAALAGVGAIAMALYHRSKDGGGQVIDLSLLEPMLLALGIAPTAWDKLGVLPQRHGNRSGTSAPRNVYRTADDKWVAVSASADTIAARVLTLVGHPELVDEEWFNTAAGRWEHVELIDKYVSDWIAERTRDQVLAEFADAGAACGPVYTADDLMTDPQVASHEMFVAVDDEQVGTVRQHNVLFRMSETPGAIRFPGRAHGADTEDVLIGELGVTQDELTELRNARVIR